MSELPESELPESELPVPEPETEYVFVAEVAEIAAGSGQRFEMGNRSIAVFNVGGQFYAIDDLCPHMGASLVEGPFENCIVTCPWHAWRFDVRDGAWCDNPRIRTDSFPVRIDGGKIYLGLPAGLLPGVAENVAEETKVIMSSHSDAARPAAEQASVTKSVECPSRMENGPTLSDFQRLIHEMYFEKDQVRGVSGTFMWLMEEIGELATALRGNDRENLAEEFADVLAWLVTIANVAGVDLAAAVSKKYGTGCPGCGKLVCVCPDAEKP